MNCPKCKFKQSAITTDVYKLTQIIPNGNYLLKEQCPLCGYNVVYDQELFQDFLEVFSQEVFSKPYDSLSPTERTPEYFYNYLLFLETLIPE